MRTPFILNSTESGGDLEELRVNADSPRTLHSSSKLRICGLCAMVIGMIPMGGLHAGFDLEDAKNYDILASGGGGGLKILNSTNTGNIAIGAPNAKKPSIVLSNTLIDGEIDFAGVKKLTSSGSTVLGAVSASNSNVTADIKFLADLSTRLGAEQGTAASIHLTGGSSLTINASNGTLDGNGNRIFNLAKFFLGGNSILTINGENLGNSVVFNWNNNTNWGFGYGSVHLTGGLNPDQVLWNTTVARDFTLETGTSNNVAGVFLDPKGTMQMIDSVLHGRFLGGSTDPTYFSSGPMLISNSRIDSIPEPSTYALLFLGAVGMLIAYRKGKGTKDSQVKTVLEKRPLDVPVPDPPQRLRRKRIRVAQCWM